MKVLIPSPLRSYTAERSWVEAQGGTLGEVRFTTAARVAAAAARHAPPLRRDRPRRLAHPSAPSRAQNSRNEANFCQFFLMYEHVASDAVWEEDDSI